MHRSKGIFYILMLFGFQLAFAHSSEEIPGEFLVKINPEVNAASTLSTFSTAGSTARLVSKASNLLLVKRPLIEQQSYAIETLKAQKNVDYVEPNMRVYLNNRPNDPSIDELWGLINEKKDGARGVDIMASEAWGITTGSKDVVVAVIDTGVDYTHQDLANNMWVNSAEFNGDAGVDDDGNGFVDDIYGYNFADNKSDPMDDQGHGTHCSGTIGAKGNDGVGIVGVNWDVSIMALKFLDKQGSGTLEGAISAIDYAIAKGAKVLSNSWGGYFTSDALEEAVERSNKAGAVFIAAAGNESNDNDKRNKLIPASLGVANIISVAAIQKDGALAWFSNTGRKSVHIGAPGKDIYSTVPGGYDTYSGTSMATPHVAGVAALILSAHPGLSGLDVKERIINSATPLSSLKGKTRTGGLLNAYEAVK